VLARRRAMRTLDQILRSTGGEDLDTGGNRLRRERGSCNSACRADAGATVPPPRLIRAAVMLRFRRAMRVTAGRVDYSAVRWSLGKRAIADRAGVQRRALRPDGAEPKRQQESEGAVPAWPLHVIQDSPGAGRG
jgi:hypothetical protein